MDLIAKSNVAVIVGMGITGRSAARYFAAIGQAFVWLDTRQAPPALDDILQEFPALHYELGELKLDTLLGAEEIILSPGVPINNPVLQEAITQGVPVLGDIDVFLRAATAPLVAITGSNAKSTVTSLLGKMALAAGKKVAVGGNIGVPVLDLLNEKDINLYVLELSSFQLETVKQLSAEVATVLNVSADHMDRYASLGHYHQAKQRVYFGARKVVINRADALTAPPLAAGVKAYSFGLDRPDRHGFGLISQRKDGCSDEEYLAYEFKTLMPVSDIKMPGRHNVENALSALALGWAAGLPMEPMLSTLRSFNGLPHRCEWVAEQASVAFYNDSKGTNVGATLAALNGLNSDKGKIVLIAGGVGKGADFSPLKKTVEGLRAVVLIGEDAPLLAEQFNGLVDVNIVDSMSLAVAKAAALAQPGDVVLLSPACASFDMFTGFEDRGHHFVRAVREVLA